MSRRVGMLVALFFLLGGTGCITRAGGSLAAIEPFPPTRAPAIEYTVGDFEFTLEGGKMVTSNKAGRLLADQILQDWKKKGYITSFSYVESGSFSPNAGHRIILSGSQYGDSSIVAQFFSGLTLYILPYTVDTKFDIQYSYANEALGANCTAEVADSYHTTVELLLMFAAPIALRGQQQTIGAMGDHLYQQLRSECNFGG